jgi:hypothetical protein
MQLSKRSSSISPFLFVISSIVLIYLTSWCYSSCTSDTDCYNTGTCNVQTGICDCQPGKLLL